MKTPILILIRLRRFMIRSKLKENRCILIFFMFQSTRYTFNSTLISTFGRSTLFDFSSESRFVPFLLQSINQQSPFFGSSRDFYPIWVMYPLRPKIKKKFFIPFFQKTATLLPVKNASKRTSKLVFFNNMHVTLCHRMTMLFS